MHKQFPFYALFVHTPAVVGVDFSYMEQMILLFVFSPDVIKTESQATPGS
jgi:hypothetical protein